MDPQDQDKLDECLKRQLKLGAEAESIIKNYKKLRTECRTITVHSNRLKQLQKLRKEFQENHEWLETVNVKNSDYFVKNYFEYITGLIDTYANQFTKEIKSSASPLQSYFQYQLDLSKQIDDVISKADAPGPQVTKSYLEKIVKDIEALFAKYDTNDTIIKVLAGFDESNEYFVQQQYDSTYMKSRRAIDSANTRKSNMPADIIAKTPVAPQRTEGLSTANREFSSYSIQPPTELLTLIRRQNAMISSLQRIMNANVPQDTIVSNTRALWDQIQELHFSIFAQNVDPTSHGYDLEEYLKIEEQVLEVSASTVHDRQQTNNVIQTISVPTNVPLPKINIPKFDGNYENWATFADLFTMVIHEQPMAAIQKFWYLKSHLSGEAERLIRHLSLTDANYSTAWEILQDRYDNKRVVIASIMQQLLKHPHTLSEANSIKTFHDSIKENLAAMKNLKIDISSWDPMLMQIFIEKLDRHTHALYESSLKNPKEPPRVEEFLRFLEQRFQALESMGPRDKSNKSNQHGQSNNSKAKATSASITSNTCKLCEEPGHPLYYCKKFIDMKTKERSAWVRANNLCLNCFKPDHRATDCEARSCKHCDKKHNSLLHFESKKDKKSGATTSTSATTVTETTTCASSAVSASTINEDLVPRVATVSQATTQNYVLLATARVRIVANNGQTCIARAVLDAGSQVNLITQKLINKLSISASKTQLSIEGVGKRTGNSSFRVNVTLESCAGNYTTRLEAFVMPHIISAQPSRNLEISNWNMPTGINLADPYFNTTHDIDILVGAEFYHHLLMPEQLHLGKSLPLLQNTVLGWIVIGKAESKNTSKVTCAAITSEEEKVSELMERFWKTEDLATQNGHITASEKFCERHFANTVSKNEEGRFVVRLPFSDSPSVLGNSQSQAEKRFQAIERKLKLNPNLQIEYKNFMQEYEKLNHMQKIQKHEIPTPNYFIPHHCVLKPDSSTTKLRVVFDASAKTSSGKSLNEILHNGPTVQSELFSILLRFRIHKFVFTADIEKMYRQILVHEDDCAYQLIVWRNNENENYQYYRLKTVTYGTTSAPYLATKCLQHLALHNKTKYPLGSAVIHDDFYVDDCLSGADEISTAQEMQRQTTFLLKEAGFNLRKWCSNSQNLLSGIPIEDQEINLDLEKSSQQTIKTLGLIWLPKSDLLCGRAKISPLSKITKRTVSSDLARIFDPLGLFGPVTVNAKIFMQQLWQLKIDWDEEIPTTLQQHWLQFRNELQTLNTLKTPRHVFRGHTTVNIQIHTFVDASEKAYGAAVYIRSINEDKTTTVQLLCAKSRIAPMKKLSIPRLELCAAVLGAELTSRVQRDLKTTSTPTFLWSDSTIVLSWIQSPSSALHTFVANRISAIQQLSKEEQWHHVSSIENPADLLSRGVNPANLDSNSTWFFGPSFLYETNEWWNEPIPKIEEMPNDNERKLKHVVAINPIIYNKEELIYKIDHKNSFRFLLNTVAYLHRPLMRQKPQHLALTPIEIQQALLKIVKTIQSNGFPQELTLLKRNKAIARTSPLSSLTPFVDSEDILRVGGRLNSSTLQYDSKHPMVLPYNDPIVKLLFKQKHEENSHCGIQSLLAAMRQNFWPIKGKVMARSTVYNCIRCSRAKPNLMGQIMGNLPPDRVTMTRPFLNTGIDYCGPVWIHYKIRGKKPTKAYIAVFCCFATKAVHLELVTDLTTNAFLGALQRFIGRRGRCKTIYCDNATNFLGAKNQLEELEENIFSQHAQEKIIRESSTRGIEFKFIPPRAPHFGGLWEAAVKSAKYLLVRTVSTASLTYEELETVLVSIEATLNSRPLTPMSIDPNDLSALTPGHFLIGEPLTAIPDPRSVLKEMNTLQRWDLVSKLRHEFWRRWSKEYLNELQCRQKWKTESPSLKENDMVIIKDDNIPVMSWPIGRVERIYKGDDGRIRVADIKTSKGTCKRPIHLLAPLPSAEPINVIRDQGPITSEISTPNMPQANLEARPRQKKNTSPVSSLVSVAFIALLLLPVMMASQVIIEKFPNKPGIYFEGLGTVHRIVGEWKIISYYDLVPIHDEVETFKNGTILLEYLCSLQQQEKMCFELVKHFKGINIELQETRSVKRLKRGAINIVGNIANKLFGVLDNEYAEDISKQIKQLNDNDHMLVKMIQNQTSVIDTTLNVIKKESEKIQIKINALQNEANSLSKEVLDVKKRINLLEVYTSTVAQLSLLASDIQRLEADILDALTGARHGKISPMLISPQQLHQELIKIKAHLPSNLHLPINTNDVIHLYDLMSSQCGISSDHIIFIMRIPLINNEVFNLFNIIPIPAVVNDTMVTIEPNTPLIAVTPHLDQYFAVTRNDLMECKKFKESSGQLLCSDKATKYHQGSQAYSCEINLLTNGTEADCILKESKSNIIWSPLQHSNQWIFGSKYTTKISAVCNSTTQLLELQGSTLLTLPNDCTLKHSSATIEAHQTFVDTFYESHAAFGIFDPTNKSFHHVIFNSSPMDISNELSQLKRLQKMIKDQNLIELPKTVETQSMHHHLISYAALFLVIGSIIGSLWSYKRLTQSRSVKMDTVSTPALRFSADPELAN